MVLVFEEEVMVVILACGPQAGRPGCEKDKFYNEISCEWDVKNSVKMVLGLGNFNGHVGRCIDGFEGVFHVCW